MSLSINADAIPLCPDLDGALARREVGERTSPRWNADRAVTAIYREHYGSLVRLALLLVADLGTAEDVVQDSFVAMHNAWRGLRNADKGLCYLRQSVVNRARSVLRHRSVAQRHAPSPVPDMPSAEHGALTLLERAKVVEALGALAPRQREVLVLRFYADLPETEIAAALGISLGAVKSHAFRGMAALRAALKRDP